MKALFRKLNKPFEQAFHIRKDIRTCFDDAWHYHEMLELVYIIEGSGERYIGDSIENFGSGDIVLLGNKLPHVWKSTNKKVKSEAIVIQFPKEIFGGRFLELTEAVEVNELIKRSERGIVFNGRQKKKLAEKILNLIKCNGMTRLIKFLELLHALSIFKKYKLLASPIFIVTIYSKDIKINKVFNYVMEHFKGDINLTHVANHVSMNKTAFCRYFKKTNNKTFALFLNEIRIGNASKLIREGQLSISQAAYDSGYNSLSNFYKHFKKINGMSPKKYIADYINKL